jgi:hypothetical protein
VVRIDLDELAGHRTLLDDKQELVALGWLPGGTLGSWLGNRAALRACAIGACLAPIWVLASPLRKKRDTDPVPAEPGLAPEPTTS